MKSLAARKALLAVPASVLEPRVNVALAEALLELGAADAVLRLSKLASDVDPDVQRQALLRLALKRDPRIRPRVHAMLGTLSVAERVPVLGEMARHQDRQALEALRLLLPSAARDEVDLHVADQLVSAGDEAGRAFLENVAKQGGSLQLLAARLLAERDDPSYFDMFCQHVAAPRPVSERTLAVEGIGACRLPTGVPVLSGLLTVESEPLRLRLAAAEAILLVAQLDPDQMAVGTLLWVERALGDPRWPVRQQATVPLGDADPRIAVPLLKISMADRQPEVRQSAAQSLARTHSKDAVPLVGAALNDSSPMVRRQALHAIGELGSHLRAKGDNVADIIRLVDARRGQGDASERVEASGALAALKDARGASDLLGWLKNIKPIIRYAAAALLAEQGSKAGVAELRAVAAGTGARATLAAGLLSRLGIAVARSPKLAFASNDPAERAAALPQIARLPMGEALPLLRRAVRDSSVDVRRVLARELAQLAQRGEAAVLPILRSLVGDSDAQTRTHAMAVLARLAPRTPSSEATQQAVVAYVQGDAKKVLELAPNPSSPLGRYAAAMAACRSKDAQTARQLFSLITDAVSRQAVAAQCQKAGIELQRSAREAQLHDDDLNSTDAGPMPPPSAPQPAPTAPAGPAAPLQAPAGPNPTPLPPREKPMRNKEIRLPKKVTDAIPSLDPSTN
jgi:HEAT repeat protein